MMQPYKTGMQPYGGLVRQGEFIPERHEAEFIRENKQAEYFKRYATLLERLALVRRESLRLPKTAELDMAACYLREAYRLMVADAQSLGVEVGAIVEVFAD